MQHWKRNTAVFMTSQIVSLFGSALVQYAITWYITLQTQDPIYVTLSIVCGFVPTFLLSPFAGVWADRYDRKKLIVLADGAIAFTTLLLAFAFIAGYNYMWLLFVALAVRGLGTAVQTPCVSALLPDIVPTEHLTRINGLNGSVQSLSMIISPMLSAALLGIVKENVEYIFFIDVVTAAIAIFVMLAFLKVPQRHLENKAEGAAADYFGELKQGLLYIRRHSYLLLFFLYCALFYFMAAPASFLTPLQVVYVFGADERYLAAIEIAFAVGMILGGLAITLWGGFKNRTATIFMSVVVMGIGVTALGFPVNLVFYLVTMGVVGFVMPLFNTPATVMLQERVEPAYLGRVFSVLTMLSTSMMPLGMLVFGPLANRFSIEVLLWFSGAVILVLAVCVGLTPALRKAGRPLPVQPAEGTEG